ncbi:hypothetical protein [Streptomyces sp. NPDC058401]|uniref:hypothetical protein n=1 Tax=Streptomyces sp. NPDC058401 TaxID=3346480 RepID=UPI00366366CB
MHVHVQHLREEGESGARAEAEVALRKAPLSSCLLPAEPDEREEWGERGERTRGGSARLTGGPCRSDRVGAVLWEPAVAFRSRE